MKLGVLKKEETERQGRESGRIWITSRFFYLFFFIYGFYMELRGVRSDWLAGRI